MLAALGEREAELGGDALRAAERSVVRRQAVRVLAWSLALGIAGTAAILALGVLAGRVHR